MSESEEKRNGELYFRNAILDKFCDVTDSIPEDDAVYSLRYLASLYHVYGIHSVEVVIYKNHTPSFVQGVKNSRVTFLREIEYLEKNSDVVERLKVEW